MSQLKNYLIYPPIATDAIFAFHKWISPCPILYNTVPYVVAKDLRRRLMGSSCSVFTVPSKKNLSGFISVLRPTGLVNPHD